MGMSDDIETILLAESLLNDNESITISYSDYVMIRWNYPSSIQDYSAFHNYIMFIRNKYFPNLVYSPYTKTFKKL